MSLSHKITCFATVISHDFANVPAPTTAAYPSLEELTFAIPVLRVQLRFVNCINKRKKNQEAQQMLR